MSSNSSPKGVISGSSGSERRRSSASSASRFNNLMNQKRNSTDVSASTRKASFDEQKPAPGFVGSLWNSFTKGSGSAGFNPGAGAGK